ALEALAGAITAAKNPGRAALGALACGALVEVDASPEIALKTTMNRLITNLSEAAELIQVCRLAAHAEGKALERAEDLKAYLEGLGRTTAEESKHNVNAFLTLDLISRPTVAMLSRSSTARIEAKADEKFVQALQSFPVEHEGLSWLTKLLNVLDDE